MEVLSLRAYESRAVQLHDNPWRLHGLRVALRRAKRLSPLFDGAEWVHALETQLLRALALADGGGAG
jgi:hypothetical protein